MSLKISSISKYQPSMSLKRSLYQQKKLQSDPFEIKASLNLSRHVENSSICLPTLTKSESEVQIPFTSSNINLDYINKKIVEEIDQQYTSSVRVKSKKSFYHFYEQKQDFGSIWISQPKWIPIQVQKAYQQKSNALANEKVNFMQGFLGEIGFMYYMVQRNIYFYDVETINENSVCHNIIEIQKKMVNACYGMQILTIGQPYVTKQRKVLALLQIYEVEIYHFEIVKDSEARDRTIEIKSLNLRYSISNIKPTHLLVSKRGLIYYVNDKGSLQQIQPHYSSFTNNLSQIMASSKRYTQEFKDFWVRLAKNISHSIRSYAKSVFNLSKSIFRSSAPQSLLVYDWKRNLLLLYKNNKEKNKDYSQQLKVYDQSNGKLLYIIGKQELLQKSCINDRIIKLKALQDKLNSDYNIVALLNTGRRIFYDISADALRKTVVYQTPSYESKGYSDSSYNVATIQSSILQETYLAQLMSSSSSFSFNVIREQIDRKYETICKLDVQLHGSPRENQYYMFNRQLEGLGPIKNSLLCQNLTISPKDMNQQVRQVFYHPQQIIHSSDKLSQRIVICRPIDIFYGIVNAFQNLPQISKALSIVLPSLKKQQIISYGCQILLDEEGTYYVSWKQIMILKTKLNIRMDQYQRRDMQTNFELVEYKQLSKNLKNRIQAVMIQTVNQGYQISNEERESVMSKGIIKYFAKILRCVWFSNLNDLDGTICRTVITILMTYKKFIAKIRKVMRLQNEGPLTYLLSWCEKLRQLFILVRTLPKLPTKLLHETILLDPEEFHEYLFDFLMKFCKQQLAQQLKATIPIYANESFLKSFRFWLSLKELKTLQQKIKFSKDNNESIPQYLINIIAKQRGLSDIKIELKKPNVSAIEAQQHFKNISYTQILKCVKQSESGLIQKELLLSKAEEKLKEEAKYNESILAAGKEQINEIRVQIKLQRLIKLFYTTNKSNQEGWKLRLSRKLNLAKQNENVQNNQVCNMLDRYVLDSETLGELVAYSKDDYLQIVYASYYTPDRLRQKIDDFIDKTINSCRTIKELPSQFKSQFKYFLYTADIDLPIEVFIKIYVEKVANVQQILEILKSQEGILEQEVFFFLSYCAELKGKPQRLFKWATKTLAHSDRNSVYFLYLCTCATYLVRNFLNQKKGQLELILLRGGNNEVILKKLVALLNDKLI